MTRMHQIFQSPLEPLQRLRPSLKGFRRVGTVAVMAVYVCVSVSNAGTAAALPINLLNSLRSGVYYANPDEDCGFVGGADPSGDGTVSNHGKATWNSNVQPPYYLESFVINVLQDIAQVANVPDSQTVTQEHVVALVAWAWEEGGNIANTDIFNPWNTGLNDPTLIAGGHRGDGVQSFKSFNAGVTAATITMTGSLQNRIEKDLIQQNSTAEQFMQALTYYQRYPGNQAWAGADVTDQQGYITGLMAILSQTRKSYDQYASVVIGFGEENTHHVPASQLKYGGGNSNPTSGTGTDDGSGCSTLTSSVSCSSSGQVATSSGAAIACQALKYDTLSYSQGWHSSGLVFHQNCDQTYKSVGRKPPALVDGGAVGPLCATDCSGLVTLVLYDLFHNNGSWTTFTMIPDTANFRRVPVSQLQPGDFIQPNPDHVEIIEQVHSNTLDTFAAHTEHAPQPDQVGPAHYDKSSSYVYLRYVGKGSNQ